MQKIIKLYEDSLEEGFSKIEEIMTSNGLGFDLKKDYEEALSVSCNNIISKWKSGKKYARTSFVVKAYSEDYSNSVLRKSIFIDVMVNILDDLLDEDMDGNEKKLYVLEFLRVFALNNKEILSAEEQLAVSDYFYKLISLATAEAHFNIFLEKESDIDKLVDNSIKVLDCRSMDIEIFNELVLMSSEKKYSDEEKEGIRKIARIFRAVNILRKDIDDMDHDIETGQESLVLKIYNKRDCDFNKYIGLMTDNYLSKAKIALDGKESNVPVVNFYKMLYNELEYIKNNAKK